MEATDMRRSPLFYSLGDAVPMILDSLSHVVFRVEVSDASISVYNRFPGENASNAPLLHLGQKQENPEQWSVTSQRWPEFTSQSLDKAVRRFTMGCLAIKSAAK